jgi:hypothetical protein
MRLAKGRAAIIGIVFVRININDISFDYFLHSQVVDQYCGDEGSKHHSRHSTLGADVGGRIKLIVLGISHCLACVRAHVPPPAGSSVRFHSSIFHFFGRHFEFSRAKLSLLKQQAQRYCCPSEITYSSIYHRFINNEF